MKWKICLLAIVVCSFGCNQNEENDTTILLQQYQNIRKQKPDIDGEKAKVWTLKKTDLLRINLVEIQGDLTLHYHPDAEHSLMVIEGTVKAFVGDSIILLEKNDFISIPKSVPHRYSTITSKALLVSMDAPYYDPKKTVRLD